MGSRSFGGAFTSQTLEDDVTNLECQIRNLLKSMDRVEEITEAKVLPLPPVGDEGPSKIETFANSMDIDDPTGLSDLDILELCVNQTIIKYKPLEETVFFVPILEKCVFGISLLNSSNSKMKKPKIYLDFLQSSADLPANMSTSTGTPSCFQYDTQVTIKESKINAVSLDKSSAIPDIFQNYSKNNVEVPPGCQVLVTATFPYPDQVISQDKLSLGVSLYYEDKKLWAREVPISGECFKASYTESVLDKHYMDLCTALGTVVELFRVERLLAYDDISPGTCLERFMETLGFQKIGSVKTGMDTELGVYLVKQPVLLWGSSYRLETCSRKPSAVRVMISTRGKDQMRYIFAQLRGWLQNERRLERKHGYPELTITPLSPSDKDNLCGLLESELELLSNLEKVQSKLKKGGKREESNASWAAGIVDVNSVSASWLLAYSQVVEKTDLNFVTKMKNQFI